MAFIDLFDFKSDDDIKRHVVKISLDDDSYSKLRNPTLNFEYLMLKNFNTQQLKKALNDYRQGKFNIPAKTSNQISGYFSKTEYEVFYSTVKGIKGKEFSTINYCAKVLFYWLSNNSSTQTTTHSKRSTTQVTVSSSKEEK